MRWFSRGLLFYVMRTSVFFYASPANFNYWYNFGILAFYFLLVQILTGIFLAMFYSPHYLLAFDSLIYLNNEVFHGWWFRALHSSGSSWFFFVVYIHILRGFYYGSFSFPRQLLWVSGILIWILMIVTAFLGYVLPWGQMSFWAAIVITSFIGSIPVLGNEALVLIWGGYSVHDLTLRRFYSLHFMLPFIILFVVLLHMFFLHEFGSSNPLGLITRVDSIPFMPYYGLKDFGSIIFVWLIFFFLIFYIPDLITHSDNFIESDTFVTPEHIVPEWYFLSLYAILRSVVDKLLGLILGALSVIGLLVLPATAYYIGVRSSFFKPFYRFFFFVFCFVWLMLFWLGGMPIMDPFYTVSRVLTVIYFFMLYFFLPMLLNMDGFYYIYNHIDKCVDLEDYDGRKMTYKNL